MDTFTPSFTAALGDCLAAVCSLIGGCEEWGGSMGVRGGHCTWDTFDACQSSQSTQPHSCCTCAHTIQLGHALRHAHITHERVRPPVPLKRARPRNLSIFADPA